jgi:hypothetical protein
MLYEPYPLFSGDGSAMAAPRTALRLDAASDESERNTERTCGTKRVRHERA